MIVDQIFEGSLVQDFDTELLGHVLLRTGVCAHNYTIGIGRNTAAANRNRGRDETDFAAQGFSPGITFKGADDDEGLGLSTA